MDLLKLSNQDNHYNGPAFDELDNAKLILPGEQKTNLYQQTLDR